MTIQEWGSVPSDPSPYSAMWDSPEAFGPSSFSENTTSRVECNDLCWAVLFFLNLAATVAVFAYVGVSWREVYDAELEAHNTTNATQQLRFVAANATNPLEDLPRQSYMTVLATCIGVSAGANIIHLLYVTFASYAYIKFGFLVGVILGFLFVIPLLMNGLVVAIVFPCLMALISLILFLVLRRYFQLSAVVLSQASRIICRNPGILGVVLLQGILTVAVSGAYVFAVFCVAYCELSGAIYVYLLFSYLWVSITIGYVAYLTASGLGATWYFLNGTDCYPESPVLGSLKRASTTSFGSACIAGLLLAIVWLLRIFVLAPSKKQGCFITCLKVIAICLLRCIDNCIGFVTRYGLIYCATFGVPFREGCRRWTELSTRKFADLIMRGLVIGHALIYNFVLFVVGATILGFGIARGAVTDASDLTGQLAAVGTLVLTIAIFSIFQQPIRAISDTLLVCFAEDPDRLKSSAEELYDRLASRYGKAVAEAAARD